MNLSFILIPGWMEQALKAANLPLSTALDVEKLCTILSKDDVSFYCYANPILLQGMFGDVVYDHCIAQPTIPEDVGRKIIDLMTLQPSVSRKNAYGSAFSIPGEPSFSNPPAPEATEVSPTPAMDEVDLFNLVEIADNIIAVLPIRASVANTDPNILLKDCYSKAISFFHRYIKLEDIAMKAVFKRYTELSRKVTRSYQ